MLSESVATTRQLKVEAPPTGGAASAAVAGAPRKFNRSIHGARGLFCLFVFFYHVHNSGLPTYDFMAHGLPYEILDVGKYGVELFFGISGIVIVGTLTRASSGWDFLVNRLTRILPALWLSIIAMTIITLASHLYMPGPVDYLLNFVSPPPVFEIYLMNRAAWSLQYELTFYLIAAAVWKIGQSNRRLSLVIAAAGIALLLFYPRGLLLLGGVAVALGFGADRFTSFLARAPGLMVILFLALWRLTELRFGGAGGVGDVDIAAITPASLPLSAWAPAFGLILVAGWIGTVALLGISRETGLFTAVLRSPPMQWLGLVSYSFYIWHPLVMGVVKAALHKTGLVEAAGPSSQLALFLLALPPALLAAGLSQAWIEVWLTAQLRNLFDRAPPPKHAPNIPT